jgi:hypothetical protein
MKKKLTRQEEFDIMKLVLDKFLWLGFGIMVFGLYSMAVLYDITRGFWFMIAGAIILIVFLILIVKEYELIK